MSDVDIPDLDHLIRQRNELANLVKALDDRTIAELHRRAQHDVADAYGAGQPEVAVTSSSELTPVERAANAELYGGSVADPVRGLIATLFNHLGCAVVHAVAIGQKQKQIARVSDPKGRESTLQGECACCGRAVLGTANDRLRSGYCEPCYRAWLDAGKPGSDPQESGDRRGQWEAERRAWLRETGKLTTRHIVAS